MHKILLCLFFLKLKLFISAQSIEVNILKLPCDSNGIVVAKINGIGNTSNLTWIWFNNEKEIIQNNIANGIDTLFNVRGGHLSLSVKVGSVTKYYYDTIVPFSFQATSEVIQRSCPQLSSVKVEMQGGTPPYTVEWYRIQKTIGFKIGTQNPIELPRGYYGFIVKDSKGCVYGEDNWNNELEDNTIEIMSNSGFTFDLEKNDANCVDGEVKVINIIGGKLPFSYQWSNGANADKIQNLSKGTYDVTVTDANGCSDFKSINVNQLKNIVVQSLTKPEACNEKNGSIKVFPIGGKAPYIYNWNNGAMSDSLSNLAEGIYTVRVIDADGCLTDLNKIYVSKESPLVVSIASIKQSSCTSPTGEATLKISGGKPPYSIEWLTPLKQTGLTLTNVAPGLYSFVVEDSMGCKREGSVNIQQENTYGVNIAIENAVCSLGLGKAGVNIINSISTFRYQWSNGAKTPTIENLKPGIYHVTVTDDKNCSQIKSVTIKEVSSLNLLLRKTPASCLFSQDGAIQSDVYGGKTPYSFSWSTGATSQNVGGLKSGYYSLNVQDANGCLASNFIFLDYNTSATSCYCTIEGVVYHDINENCKIDVGEKGIENIQIYCKGIGFTYTDEIGYYSFKVPTGVYELSEAAYKNYPISSCQVTNYSVSVLATTGCVQQYNFGHRTNPIHDVRISLWSDNLPIPGFSYHQSVVITNLGTTKENNIVASYSTDEQIGIPTFFGTSVFQSVQNGLYSNKSLINLAPGKSELIKVSYNIPKEIPIGTEIQFKDTTAYTNPISNWISDETPWDNIHKKSETVVSSFDPNFIQVSPQGVTEKGFISSQDTVLEYMIHFQNYGTHYAQNVIVQCQLDNNLIWNSLNPIYASAPYSVNLTENGALTYTFKNINLTPKSLNEGFSKGFFTFTIKTKKGLVPFTKIQQEADIFFDYNVPIRTNIALNTIEEINGIEEIEVIQKIFPNPVQDFVYVQLDNFITEPTFIVYDILGRIVFKLDRQTDAQKTIKIDLSTLQKGIYFIGIQSNGKLYGKAKRICIL